MPQHLGSSVQKTVQYLNKDFSQFREALINFSKQYFPNTFNDFGTSSPGMLFMELASYVGDVLSFYIDSQLKETLMIHAEEKKNIYSLALSLGYKPRNSIAASVDLDVFQLLPAIGSGDDVKPDYDYSLTISAGMVVRSTLNSEVEFRTQEPINFNFSSSLSPTEVTVYQIDESSNEPVFYLLKKSVKAISGKKKEKTFNFTSPKIYDKIVISDTDIIEILDIFDSDEDQWHQVPYLAQDTIFQGVINEIKNDPNLARHRGSVPYLLKLIKTTRRFIIRLKANNELEIQFGAGISDNADEEIIPNPDNVGSSLIGLSRTVDIGIDPSNFLYTKTYGLAPANTTLTVRYTTGGGVQDNVPSDDLTDIVEVDFGTDASGLDTSLLNQVKASVACTNPIPASGGKNRESLQELKNNAMAFFAAQNRAVTKDDYIIRTYSLPPKYGAIAKAYIVQDEQINPEQINQRIQNPLALNLYVLGFDSEKKLTTLNDAIKENLKNYLTDYRLLTDAIYIKDAFIINIGLNFEIIVLPNFNSNEVLFRCIDSMKDFFKIDKWQINQPIIESSIATELAVIQGVQSVVDVEIVNLFDSTSGYSGNIYNINQATLDRVIFSSLDPAIFEVRFPQKDIKGRVVTF